MIDASDLPVLWQDTGCNLYPACLSCPLPRCRYDETYDRHAEKRADWNARVLVAIVEGMSRPTVLERVNISHRTLQRIIEQGRRS